MSIEVACKTAERTFPGCEIVEVRRDPEGDGWFVRIDDPANEFEYVEIYVNDDGTWEE